MSSATSTEKMAALPPLGETVILVNPPSVAYQVRDGSITLIILPTFFILARIYTRKWIVKSLGWDDFWIVLAWIFGVVLGVGFIVETIYGSGKHLWDVKESDFQKFLKFRWVIGTAYYLAQAFTKFSVCVFYLRLSPNQTFRRLVYATMIFVACYSVATILVNFFACTPIAAAWDPTLLKRPGAFCINRFVFYFAQAGLNIGTDVWIVALPMKTVWSLQMKFRQRLTVSLIFAAGLSVCAISMVRIKYIKVLLTTKDLTWDNNRLFFWSTIEVQLLLISASAPTLTPLVSLLFPTFLGRGSQSSRNGLSKRYNKSNQLSSVTDTYGAGNTNPYQMKNLYAGPNSEPTQVNVSSKRQRDSETESQEDIIDKKGFRFDDGIVVSKTVNVS